MENELRKIHPRMWEEKVRRAVENKEDGWMVREGGLVTWHERVYIPRVRQIREQFIAEHHRWGHSASANTAKV